MSGKWVCLEDQMLVITLIVFLIGAAFGIFLLRCILKNKNTPKPLAIVHGSFGVCGILLLLGYTLFISHHAIISLILFILAAIGGYVLFWRDITGKPLPHAFIFGHALLAIVALGFLICAIVN